MIDLLQLVVLGLITVYVILVLYVFFVFSVFYIFCVDFFFYILYNRICKYKMWRYNDARIQIGKRFSDIFAR